MGSRNGDWFFWGALATLAAQHWTHLSGGWLIMMALVAGMIVNEQKRPRDA